MLYSGLSLSGSMTLSKECLNSPALKPRMRYTLSETPFLATMGVSCNSA